MPFHCPEILLLLFHLQGGPEMVKSPDNYCQVTSALHLSTVVSTTCQSHHAERLALRRPDQRDPRLAVLRRSQGPIKQGPGVHAVSPEKGTCIHCKSLVSSKLPSRPCIHLLYYSLSYTSCYNAHNSHPSPSWAILKPRHPLDSLFR